MSNENLTVQQQLRRITAEPVDIALTNVRTEVKNIGTRLSQLPLTQHKSIMAQLEVEMNLREQTMQEAIHEAKAAEQRAASKTEAAQPQPVQLAK